MSGEELMSLSMIQIFVLPASQKRIETKQKKEEEAKLVSNFESYATTKVTKLIQTLGNIANPHDQYKTSVSYLGNNAILTDLKRGDNRGGILRHVNQAISFARR